MIPENVDIKIEDGKIFVKGPKGKLKRNFNGSLVDIKIEKEMVIISPVKKNDGRSLALWGTYASHTKNMIQGVTDGFCKNLIVEGIGFKAQIEKRELVLLLGFSHPIKMIIPDDIIVEVDKNKISVCGIDKERVVTIAAKIRNFKKPEPYKGKGIRYEGEIIRRKAGKKAVGIT